MNVKRYVIGLFARFALLVLFFACSRPDTTSVGTGFQMLSGAERWNEELGKLKTPSGILPIGSSASGTGIIYRDPATTYEFFAFDSSTVLILLSNSPKNFIRIETRDFQFHLKNELQQISSGITGTSKAMSSLTYYKDVGDYSVEIYFTPNEIDFCTTSTCSQRYAMQDVNGTTYVDLWRLYETAGSAVFYTPSFDDQKIADDFYNQRSQGKTRLILADSSTITNPVNYNLKSYGLGFSFMFGSNLSLTGNLLGCSDINDCSDYYFSDWYALTRDFAAFFSVPLGNGTTGNPSGLHTKDGIVVIVRGNLQKFQDFVRGQGVNLDEASNVSSPIPTFATYTFGSASGTSCPGDYAMTNSAASAVGITSITSMTVSGATDAGCQGTSSPASGGSFGTTAWNTSNGPTNKYYDFAFDLTTGTTVKLKTLYANIRTTATGPSAFAAYYSTGGPYTQLGSNCALTNGDFTNCSFDPSGAATLTGPLTVRIRFASPDLLACNSASGILCAATATAIAAGGAVRIDDVKISGVVDGVPNSDATAPSAVSTLAAGTVTSNSIQLNWTAVGDDGGVGTASSYELRYHSASCPMTALNFASGTLVSSMPTPAASGGAESKTVTGLSPSTAYCFAIKVSDEVPNQSAISNLVNQSTGAAVQPTLKNATALNSTTVDLNFSANMGASSIDGIIASFTFNNGLTASAVTLQTGVPNANQRVRVTTSGQTASTTYLATVAGSVQDSIGTGMDTGNNTANFFGFSSVFGVMDQTTASMDNLGSWTSPGPNGSAGTLSVNAVVFTEGTRSLTYSTGTVTTSCTGGRQAIANAYYPITPGGSYKGTVYARYTTKSCAGNLNVRQRIYWYQNSTGTASATPNTLDGATYTSTTSWAAFTTSSLTAPSDAYFARLSFHVCCSLTPGGAGTDLLYIDQAYLGP